MKTGKVSEITYSEDKRSIFLFDSSITAQSPETLDFKIKVGFDQKKIQYDLDFTTTSPYGCQMDGEPPECMRNKDSKMIQDIISSGKVSGTAIINGTTINIKGTGLLCHNYSYNVKNSLQSMKGRSFININNGNDGLFINESKGKDFSIGIGNLVLDNKLVGIATDCTAEPLSTRVEPTSKYDIPTEIKYSMKGAMIESGKPFTASIVLKPECQTEVHDFLGSLPFALRFIIKAFAKPFSFQWLDPGEVQVSIGGEEEEKEIKIIKGLLLQDVMYLRK
ncbi:hypothetical protein PIROE2DRAFT_64323 [Piromyces sp. E2]|nr:hypothetical protein PIROE2DRAFT_64323 [Piromyces sp. E2]|eukprot:OUM58564.1 hypothetical protein PIROE2DRAFT_64323 [Piromyces sp. E2]